MGCLFVPSEFLWTHHKPFNLVSYHQKHSQSLGCSAEKGRCSHPWQQLFSRPWKRLWWSSIMALSDDDWRTFGVVLMENRGEDDTISWKVNWSSNNLQHNIRCYLNKSIGQVKSLSGWFGDISWYIPNPGLPFYRWWNKARGTSKMGETLCPQMPSWMTLTRNLEKSSVIWNVICLSNLPNNLSHSKNSPSHPIIKKRLVSNYSPGLVPYPQRTKCAFHAADLSQRTLMKNQVLIAIAAGFANKKISQNWNRSKNAKSYKSI